MDKATFLDQLTNEIPKHIAAYNDVAYGISENEDPGKVAKELVITDDLFRFEIEFELDPEHEYDDLLVTLEYNKNGSPSEVYSASVMKDGPQVVTDHLLEIIDDVLAHRVEVYSKKDLFGHIEYVPVIGKNINDTKIKRSFLDSKPVKIYPQPNC